MHRSYHHNEVTFSLMYAWSENFVLPLSHDEVVHGKGSLWTRMPGDDWNKAAGLRALLAFMWAHPGKQLLFMGGEFGQPQEWSESRSLDWHLLERAAARRAAAARRRPEPAATGQHPALFAADTTPEGFAWIDANDSANNVASFLRLDPSATRQRAGLRRELRRPPAPRLPRRACPWPAAGGRSLNTDAQAYGGSGWGNMGGVDATETPWHGQPASALLQLPPQGVLWLAPADEQPA